MLGNSLPKMASAWMLDSGVQKASNEPLSSGQDG